MALAPPRSDFLTSRFIQKFGFGTIQVVRTCLLASMEFDIETSGVLPRRRSVSVSLLFKVLATAHTSNRAMRAKGQHMRKFLLLTTLAAAGVIAAGMTVQAQTYGPSMMGNDQDYGNRDDCGQGYGMMRNSNNQTNGQGQGDNQDQNKNRGAATARATTCAARAAATAPA